MPVIHTQPASVVFGAGKNLGQIAAEREQYTRGAEQARMDLQKQQIKNAQTERALARIDADEKETRRQQEWEAIAKRSREAVEESKRRFGIERTELTKAQQLTEDRNKRIEQERIDKINQDKAFLKQIQEGQNVGGQVTQPTATTPAQTGYTQKYQYGAEGNDSYVLGKAEPEYPKATETTLESINKQIATKAPAQPEIKQAYTPPADIADLSTGDRDVLESIHKQLKPLNEAKLRQEANIEAYGKYGAGTKANIAAISIFNNKIKQIESDNKKVKSELIKTQNEVRENKRKAGKEGKLTPVQQFSQASKIVESASYGETIYTARQIKWAKDIVAKYTGGAATQEKVTQEKWWNK